MPPRLGHWTRFWIKDSEVPQELFARLSTSIRITHTSIKLPADPGLFRSTRYRSVTNEKEELAHRQVVLDLEELVKQAILATARRHYTAVAKDQDGTYSRVFWLMMDDHREVVVKIPTAKAGLPRYTTASEVATMEFLLPSQGAVQYVRH